MPQQEPEMLWNELMRELPRFLAIEQVKAKLMRARFEALLLEGFTEAQAVELCKDILK